MVPRVVLICISTMTNDVEHFSLCLLAMYIFFGEMSSCLLFKTGLLVFSVGLVFRMELWV